MAEIVDRVVLPIRRALRRFRLGMGALVVVILAFGWPTLYRYERLRDGEHLVRINRFTGRAWVYSTKASAPEWWPIREATSGPK